ncbi:hypothetical protein AABB24_009301, partial [Solanum stoloniferum]
AQVQNRACCPQNWRNSIVKNKQKLATLMEAEGDEGSQHTQIPSTSSKESVWAIPTLPQELITAILVRLPVKYLLQFKCVSKNWFALISSPHFVKTHLSFSAKDRFLLEIDTYILKHCSVSSLFYDSVTEAFNLVYLIKRQQRNCWYGRYC